MPTGYTTLNARVKQKLATDAYWRSIENELGVIFEGEQAFVYSEDGVAVNFKIGDGTKLYSELPFFIAYFDGVTSQKVLSWVNTVTNITIPSTFRLNSLIQQFVVYNNSGGVIDMKIGTTNGGSEICEVQVPTGAVTIGKKYAFSDVETVYITGITGKECSVWLLFFQLDEAPATPPTPTGTFKYPKGHCGIFEPLPDLSAETVWDFTTGLAKPGFGYDNCVISGTNGTKVRAGKYSVCYKVGDTIGANVGSNTNSSIVVEQNIQKILYVLPNSSQVGRSDNANDRDVMIPSGTQTVRIGVDSPTPINFQPGSVIDLYFTAVS
jgi:hypothetical protein